MLDKILGPRIKIEFINKSWGKLPFYSKCGINTYENLFDIQKLDRILMTGSLKNINVKLAQNGSYLKSDKYSVDDRIHPGKVLEFYRKGATLIINRINVTIQYFKNEVKNSRLSTKFQFGFQNSAFNSQLVQKRYPVC